MTAHRSEGPHLPAGLCIPCRGPKRQRACSRPYHSCGPHHRATILRRHRAAAPRLLPLGRQAPGLSPAGRAALWPSLLHAHDCMLHALAMSSTCACNRSMLLVPVLRRIQVLCMPFTKQEICMRLLRMQTAPSPPTTGATAGQASTPASCRTPTRATPPCSARRCSTFLLHALPTSLTPAERPQHAMAF